jgi:hypothetical protein
VDAVGAQQKVHQRHAFRRLVQRLVGRAPYIQRRHGTSGARNETHNFMGVPYVASHPELEKEAFSNSEVSANRHEADEKKNDLFVVEKFCLLTG